MSGDHFIRIKTKREKSMDRARQRAMMARKFPCVCHGKGCTECGGVGHLGDRRSYAQLTGTEPNITGPGDDLSGDLPF